MPELNPEFTISAPVDEVWAFLSDMKKVGECIPGCEVEIVDKTTSKWTMTAKMGFIAKTFNLTNKVIVQDDVNHHVEFEGDGDLLGLVGIGDMESLPNGDTSVKFKLTMSAKGGAAGVVNNIIKSKVGEYETDFVSCVRRSLE